MFGSHICLVIRAQRHVVRSGGYYQLRQDVGQLAILENLIVVYRASRDAENLEWAEDLLQVVTEGQVEFQ